MLFMINEKKGINSKEKNIASNKGDSTSYSRKPKKKIETNNPYAQQSTVVEADSPRLLEEQG